MRILFVDQFSDFGGAQLMLRDIMSEARQRGWKSWFMAPGDGPLFSFCALAGIPAQRIPVGFYNNGRKNWSDILRYGVDTLRAARAIRETVRQNQIELIYVNGPRVLPAGAAAQCPLIFHAHSLLDKGYSRLIARAALGSARIRGNPITPIAVSRMVADALGPKIRIVYNGVEDCGFVPRPRATQLPKIGIIGRISPEKGHLDFVHAARLMPEARFVVFGAALFSDPSFEVAVRAAAGDSVEFRGWTEDVPAALHEIDILAVPSLAVEATPRIIMEALSAGTPIAAYPAGSIPELVRSRETGLLTSGTGPEALASGLRTMLSDTALMSRCSVNGRREWETRFQLERFQMEVAGLISERAQPSHTEKIGYVFRLF